MPSHPLTNLLEAFPDLLSTHLLPPWPYSGDGIKLLRAVSKELGAIAGPAVHSCKVEGGGRLSSRPGAPSVPDQLSTCVAHTGAFLDGARPAVHHITRLDLRVEHNPHAKPDPRARPWTSLSRPPLRRAPNPNLHPVPRAVFAVLAAAVPSLAHLDVRASRPPLTLGEADAVGLRGIHLSLPGLTHLTLPDSDARHRCRSRAEVQSCVGTGCRSLRGCTDLTSLRLRVHHTAWPREVRCPVQTWEQLPPSLVEWDCRAEFPHMLAATAFMQRLQALSVGKLPVETLHDLLALAPRLRSLDVWPFDPRMDMVGLMWPPDTKPAELSRLRARLLGGSQLGCESAAPSGTSAMVRGMLAWTCPLAATRRVCVELCATVHVPDRLDQRSRVAPKLQDLILAGESDSQPEAPWLEEPFLHRLAGCHGLWGMDVHLQVRFTHAGLVRLCTSLPALSQLCCKPREGVRYEGVMAELALTGRDVAVTAIVQGQELPEAYEYE
ncbi:MAG: hypothetical protein WDW36_008167 [Sanguina aurantia]